MIIDDVDFEQRQIRIDRKPVAPVQGGSNDSRSATRPRDPWIPNLRRSRPLHDLADFPTAG
jgi:hypothetical protein